MKENILISLMARNNSSYIPYFHKCIDLVEKENKKYNINYIIFTNNNEDNTLELLKSRVSKNFKVVEKSYDKNFLELQRIPRLHYLREDFLNIIRKEDFDYLLMLDTSILFNEKMIRESIELLKKNNYDAVTSNTVRYKTPFFFDDFSFSHYGEKWNTMIYKYKFIKFIVYNYYSKKPIDVESSFGGFFITTSKIIKNKNLSYIKGNKEIGKYCEHKYFNSKIKNIKFINTITPIREENEKYLEDVYTLMKENKEDNRSFYRILYNEEFYVLCIILFIFFYIYRRSII